MDFFMNKIADLLDQYGGQINIPVIPWEKLSEGMAIINQYLAEANRIFPVYELLFMLSILLGIKAVLILIWTVKFIRDLLPF